MISDPFTAARRVRKSSGKGIPLSAASSHLETVAHEMARPTTKRTGKFPIIFGAAIIIACALSGGCRSGITSSNWVAIPSADANLSMYYPGQFTRDGRDLKARILYFMGDPLVKTRLPGLELEERVSQASAQYSLMYLPNSDVQTVTTTWPEYRVCQKGKTLATAAGYGLDANVSVPSGTRTREGNTEGGREFFVELLGNRAFTQNDLIQFAQSKIPEVRYAAVAHLAKGGQLDAFALGEKSDTVREMMVRNTDLSDAALFKIATEDMTPGVRLFAYTRILDREILKVHPGVDSSSKMPASVAGSTWIIRESDGTRLSWGESWGNPLEKNFFYVFSFKTGGSCEFAGPVEPYELMPILNEPGTWKQDRDTIQITIGKDGYVSFEGQITGHQMSGKITSRKPAKMKGDWAGIRVQDSQP